MTKYYANRNASLEGSEGLEGESNESLVLQNILLLLVECLEVF